ncbi:MAG: carbohydrate ABC transporter permease [Lachnospirales bacterium]
MNKNTTKYESHVTGMLMVLPTMIGLITLNIYPFFRTLWISFHKSGSFGSWSFVGLQNYINMLASDDFWEITKNTLLFVLYTVPSTIILGLLLAVLLNQKLKGTTFFRMIYFLPMVVAPAAIAMVWKWMYNTDYGIINTILGAIGLPNTINWTTNPSTALLSCAIVAIWSAIGYDAILLLSGLQGISKVYYEAAKVEGATLFAQFRFITLPLVSPTLFFVIIMRMMASLKVFDIVYMMIAPTNPAIRSTETILYAFYRQTFTMNNKGAGSVYVLWSVLIIAIFTIIQFIGQKKWVTYDV